MWFLCLLTMDVDCAALLCLLTMSADCVGFPLPPLSNKECGLHCSPLPLSVNSADCIWLPSAPLSNSTGLHWLPLPPSVNRADSIGFLYPLSVERTASVVSSTQVDITRPA
ncbi:hypothetical protein AVEN_174768-1 [Araneus ventricosus]|uniref:Secreted protein n=1 Tax=Araneus ventricosus TaxID=182803 RepID=A0A4Y2BJW2_ARAVE|nr:hypothetical protein AVEN_174768-1 [Araneus ventricosus]